jgi:glycosyltransferase involved in cell wall biosynthesis
VRICVDGGPTENGHRVRGIGTVAGALIRALTPEIAGDAEIRYVRRRPLPNDAARWAPRSWSADWAGANPRASPRVANWWQLVDTATALPRDVAATGADVFLAVDPHAVALSPRFATVAMLYDVVPLVFPDIYLTSRRAGLPAWLYRRRLRRLARADWWIAISETTKQDAVSRAGLDPTRITVAPLGIDADVFRPIEPAQARARVAERFGMRRPYLLFVGARDPRKNLDGLLGAYRALGDAPTADLVVVGQPPAPDAGDGHVHWLGQVDAIELPFLYAGALAFVFPSLYEGFGLPVLEAMSCGTPVVTSPVSSIPEVAGDAVLYADPLSRDAWREALERVSSDAALRDALRVRGLARARDFTWERTARLVIEGCRRAARQQSRAPGSRIRAG